jgi:hypothetical protein
VADNLQIPEDFYTMMASQEADRGAGAFGQKLMDTFAGINTGVEMPVIDRHDGAWQYSLSQMLLPREAEYVEENEGWFSDAMRQHQICNGVSRWLRHIKPLQWVRPPGEMQHGRVREEGVWVRTCKEQVLGVCRWLVLSQ